MLINVYVLRKKKICVIEQPVNHRAHQGKGVFHSGNDKGRHKQKPGPGEAWVASG